MKIDDAAYPAHASARRVSVTVRPPAAEQPFAHAVVFVPVLAAQHTDMTTFCDWHPAHLPPAASAELFAILDITLLRGGKRRDHVCGRCIYGALWAADRDGPVVCWYLDPAAERPLPPPLAVPAGAWPPAVVPS